MKTKFFTLIFALLMLSGFMQLKAQNNLPDSVYIKETFGTGTTKTALPAGRATYGFNGASSLNDGDYMTYYRTNGRPEWHNAPDHTGDVNGKMMVINAGMTPSEFYKDTVYSLAGNTTYSVYLYIMNVNTLGTCGSSALLPKLQFIVEYYNSTTASFVQLTTITTPFIPQTSSPQWVVAGGTFLNPAGNTTVRYRILNNSTGGCGNDLALDDITFVRANSIPNTLPVTGMQLSAQGNGGSVNLQWQTLTEINTSHFIVEKSNDNYNWIKTDSLKAAGSSNSEKQYNSYDFKAGQLNYYRVKQVDKNGRYTYSNTVSVNNNTASATVYPNPFVSQVQIDLVSETAKKAVVIITDMQGRKLINKAWSIAKGRNNNIVSEVKNFTTGMYFIEVKTTDGASLYKTTIMKN
jgi:Secretion system C-terminal sorting domain